MTHPVHTEHYPGSLSELAEEIGRDAEADSGHGRTKLSASLAACAAHLTEAATNAETAWHIAAPFMPPDSPGATPD